MIVDGALRSGATEHEHPPVIGPTSPAEPPAAAPPAPVTVV